MPDSVLDDVSSPVEGNKIATVFLTGASGQLGSALRRKWSQDEYQNKLCVVASHHETMDVGDEAAVASALNQFCPDVVVNCAGFNGSCLSQVDRDKCWHTNVLGVKNLASACAQRGALFVQVSCDAVFGADDTRHAMLSDISRLSGLGFCIDGLDCRYNEKSPCGPVDFGGATKLSGEHAVLQTAMHYPSFQYWILRTGSMFEYPWRPSKSYFYRLASMIKSRSRKVPAAADVLFNLCYATEMAKATSWMIENRLTKKGKDSLIPSGIYHMANEGGVSWYQVAHQMALSLGGGPERIEAVSLARYREQYNGDMPPMAELGRYRVLSTDLFKSLGGPSFSPWRDVVDSWCVAFGGASMAVS